MDVTTEREAGGRVGVEFTETMRGHFSTAVRDDFQRAYERGKADGSPLEFTVTIAIDDVDALKDGPPPPGRISGALHAPALSGQPLRIDEGRFDLLVPAADRIDERRMVYRMPLTDVEGRHFHLEGVKIVHDAHGPTVWADTTTLFITVSEGQGPGGPVLGRGIVHIALADFKRQLASMRVLNAPDACTRLKALARFGQFFVGALWNVYGGALARANVFNPDAPPRERRPLRCGDPEIHDFQAEDGVGLRLTRFQGGTRGPVILSPGFGTSALAFTIDTTPTNLPEFLHEHGYDVWVFDYRASPSLPSAATQFTLDDVALKDYPAAVNRVREATGAGSVQVMAHCVGSLTLLMGLAAGLEGVRSAVCSQLTLHPVAPPLNKIKAGLYLANLLHLFGVEALTADYDTRAGWLDRLSDGLLRLYPTRERCRSPVCRRILFLYGEVYDHDRLNAATHDALHEMFGVANLTTFKHITRMLHAGHAVAADGEERYLPRLDRIRVPIAFLQAANNRLFLPEGSETTYKMLCEANGPERYSRRVVPGYAHMDCFIGKDASRDVYPIVLEELEKYNPA